jgi:TRAP transporter TAXI family solute receptor
MLKKLFLISLILFYSPAIATDGIPLPPMPDSKQSDSIEKIKALQSNVDQATKDPVQSKKENPSVKKIPLKIGLSKTEDDIYLSLASAICILINEKVNTSCKIKQFNDPVEAMNAMLNGDVDIVMTNTLLGKYAVDGGNGFDKNIQFKKIKFVAALFDEKLTIISNRDANIKTLDDLQKASINIGQSFTKQRMFFDELLKLKQWNIADIKGATELKDTEQIKAICDKSVNSLIMLGSDNNQYMKDVTRFCEVDIIQFTDDELNLFNDDPRFLRTKIKGGIYLGIPQDVDTIATKAILLTTSDISNTQIENLLQILEKNLKKIKLLHKAFKDLEIKSILSQGKIAPLHDGVVEFMQKNNLKEEN